MSLTKDAKRIEYINYLIKKKATGDLKTFARKNNLCRRALLNFLNEMRDLGADIQYDRKRKTYFYAKYGEMTKCMFMLYGEKLTTGEISKIGAVDDLCFSESAVFTPCENES